MYAYLTTGEMPGLPDPERDREFYAGVPLRRFVAWCLDVVIVLAIGLPAAVLFGLATFFVGFLLFPFVLVATDVLYRTLTLANGSATWGMRFAGVELRRHDGARLDFVTALLHVSLYTLAWMTVLPQLLSCLTILGTRYGQALQDFALRTTAINKPAD